MASFPESEEPHSRATARNSSGWFSKAGAVPQTATSCQHFPQWLNTLFRLVVCLFLFFFCLIKSGTGWKIKKAQVWMWKFLQTKLVSISIKPGRCGYRDDGKTGSIPPENERKIQGEKDATQQMSITYAKTSTFTKKKTKL